MKTTVFRLALALLMTACPSPHRGGTAAGEDSPGEAPAKPEPASRRVRIPIEGVEFHARSIRLSGAKVTATGDLRARLERFPRVEIRAARLEYRVGGDKVELLEPVWTYPDGEAGETERPRLRWIVRAESATFRIEDQTIAAKSMRIETEGGQLALEARSGTWRSRSMDCRLESVEGDVFTATDEMGRGSLERENARVRIRWATVRISPDLTLDEIRLDGISGVERRNEFVFEAESGVVDSSHGERLREARLTRVKVVTADGRTFECDKLTYRPPDRPPAGERGEGEG